MELSGCVVVADSVEVEGGLLWCVQSVREPVVFVGLLNYFAHYSVLFKKAKVTPKTYVQVQSDWAAPHLPLTETTPITYRDAPHTVSYQGLLHKLRAIVRQGDAIVVDSIAPVFFLGGWLTCLGFVNSLREIASTVLVSVPKDLGPEFQLLKQQADVFVEVLPLSSGFSQELAGQVVVSCRREGVLREDWTSYFSLEEGGLVLK